MGSSPKIVADAPFGLDIFGIAGVALNLLPQAAYRYIHRPLVSHVVIAPDLVEKLLAGKNMARAGHQMDQQAKFPVS